MDTDFDGENEVLIGTYGQVIFASTSFLPTILLNFLYEKGMDMSSQLYVN